MGGFPAVPPQPYKNPVLDELDRLSPQAKDALSRAHQSIASIQAPPDVSATPMQPAQIPGPQRLASPPAYTPKPLGGNPTAPVATPPPMTPDQQAHVSELSRIQSTGSGVSQIKSPWARVPLQIADAIGTGLFPRIAMGLPGTEAHHQLLEHEAQQAVNSDTAQRAAQGKLGSEAATTAHTQAEIPLAEAQTAATSAEVPLREAQAAALPQTLETERQLKEAQTGHTQAETQKLNAEAEPFGDEKSNQLNGMLQQRWKVLHGDEPIPAVYQLGPKANKADWDRIDKQLEATEKAAGTKAQQDQSAELRRQSIAMAGQNHADSVALRREQMELAQEGRQNHTDTAQRTASLKVYQPALDSAERFNVMTKNFEDAAKDHNQQAMLSLLANHIGMTLGAQKGARITKDILHEAEQSRPWLQGIKAKFDKDGVLSGLTLSPDQMKQMVALGRERFAEDLAKSRSQAQYLGSTDQGPDRKPSEATMGFYLHEAKGDVNKAKQLATQDGWTVEGGK